jgi:hypothetical protein
LATTVTERWRMFETGRPVSETDIESKATHI